MDAEITDGAISQLYFLNGGYLSFSASIDDEGNASDIDENGRYWEFSINLDSKIVQDAIQDWQDANSISYEEDDDTTY